MLPVLLLLPGIRSRPTQIMPCCAANSAIDTSEFSLSPCWAPELVKPEAILLRHFSSDQAALVEVLEELLELGANEAVIGRRPEDNGVAPFQRIPVHRAIRDGDQFRLGSFHFPYALGNRLGDTRGMAVAAVIDDGYQQLPSFR